MIRRPTLCAALILLLPGLQPLGGLAQETPSAHELLEAARVLQTDRYAELRGQVRTAGKPIPFLLKLDPGVIGYHFADPPEALLVEFGDSGAQLFEAKEGRKRPLSGSALDAPVRGTGMSARDLGLEFLYWKNAEVVDTDRIRGRDTFVIDLRPPGGASRYAVVRTWVDRSTGALMRMQGYDAAGRMVRKFEVVSVTKIDGYWMLKQMRVEEYDPETGKVRTRTYIEIDPRRSEISDSQPSD